MDVFKFERKYFTKRFLTLACLDEAGRGALAGPVVAGCVLVTRETLQKIPLALRKQVKDSKLLSAKKRNKLFDIFSSLVPYRVGVVPNVEIDNIGINQATQKAMDDAIATFDLESDFIITDGGSFSFSKPFITVIDGDNLVFSVALASIFAKVTRDSLMKSEHKRYPVFGFDQHKGYGTAFHRKMIEENGPCEIHRKTFSPVCNMV